ncbi:hypothetical protein AVEN_140786-1 [Araneus ventricosus]|uniref:Uncharacterized protein n=1 Tax=Araneus ventricosus TaxID=182803 RepID=A0A4Y2SPK6_ARAVE|nr:hypothetical protein AVEN_140786-1 [Araneus ventricosus]
MRLGYQPIDTPGTEMYYPSNEKPRTANTGGNLLSMRSKKQTDWQKFLMESSLAYPRGKEKNPKNSRGGKNRKRSDTTVPRGPEARHT